MKNTPLIYFFAAYIFGLFGLAIVGYFYVDYKLESDKRHEVVSERFATDVSFVDLPQMNVKIISSNGETASHVKLTISLEVDKKNAARVQSYAPLITERISNYLGRLDYEDISQPKASAHLRPHILQIVNSTTDKLPIMDIVFRQFVVL